MLTSSTMRLPRPWSALASPRKSPRAVRAKQGDALESRAENDWTSHPGGLGVPSSNLGAPTSKNQRLKSDFGSQTFPENRLWVGYGKVHSGPGSAEKPLYDLATGAPGAIAESD